MGMGVGPAMGLGLGLGRGGGGVGWTLGLGIGMGLGMGMVCSINYYRGDMHCNDMRARVRTDPPPSRVGLSSRQSYPT